MGLPGGRETGLCTMYVRDMGYGGDTVGFGHQVVVLILSQGLDENGRKPGLSDLSNII